MGEIAASAFVLPADLAALSSLEQHVQQMLALAPPFADAEAVTYNIWLSLHELCVNIIGHAYDVPPERRQVHHPETIEIAMQLHSEPLAFEIRTHDRGMHVFDLDALATPNLDDPPIHGLGIFLIRQLMDEVVYVPAPGNNRWRLVKQLATLADATASPAAPFLAGTRQGARP